MTRLWGLLACLVLLLLAAPGPAPAVRQDDERMLRYVVAADVRPDGTVAVTEQVRYHFTKPRHGFFRFIPLYYPLVRPDGSIDAYDARKLEIDNYTATMDGHPVRAGRPAGAVLERARQGQPGPGRPRRGVGHRAGRHRAGPVCRRQRPA